MGLNDLIEMGSAAVISSAVTLRICHVVYGSKLKEARRPKPNYACICLHRVTSHERIEYRQDGTLMIKFGECVVDSPPCGCTGYIGDLPFDPGSMISTDGVPLGGEEATLFRTVINLIRSKDNPPK